MNKLGSTFTAGVLIALYATGASAQNPSRCAKIVSDLERLNCYDQIFRKPANASSTTKTDRAAVTGKTNKGDRAGGNFVPNVSAKSAKQAPAGPTKPAAQKSDPPQRSAWRSRVDGKNVILTAQSREAHRNIVGQSARLSLVIACRRNTTSLSVLFGGNIVSSVLDQVPITIVVDGKRKATRSFEVAEDFKAVGLWNGGASIPTIKTLIAARQLSLTGAPYFSKKVTAQFNIAGLAQAIKPLRKNCNW